MKMGRRVRIPAAFCSSSQSLLPMVPVFMAWMSTWACEPSIRCTSCSDDISRLKISTAALRPPPPNWAMFSANAVFPMEGRAATMFRLPG